MSQAEAKSENLDEHGLVIHRYRSMVLVVVPSQGYDETTMRYARSALFNVHVGTRTVAVDDSGLIQGMLQDEFQVDAKLDGSTSLEGYSGVILCGGPGALALVTQPDALRLAREAAEEGKLIGAWGEAVAVLAEAGVLRKRTVTGADSVRDQVRRAGGRFTGRQVELDGNLVTGVDDGSGLRFGKLLVRVVGI